MNVKNFRKTAEYLSTVYFGIDPGQSGGGVGWIHRNEYGAFAMPEPAGALLGAIGDIIRRTKAVNGRAIVERVGPRPEEPAKFCFEFGRSLGRCEEATAGGGLFAHFAWELVSVQRWQRHFDLWGVYSDPVAKKNEHKRKAATFFPDLGREITHTNADALLLAAFCFAHYAGRSYLNA